MSPKAVPAQETDREATRSQLLDAAALVFAESGFHAATVRQICRRAGANTAAVNYHFGDKETLYQCVLKETYRTAVRKYPADFGLSSKATTEQRLRAFVHSFLLRIFSTGAAGLHGKLMSLEMIRPTGALDAIVKEEIQPMAAILKSIVGDLLGDAADDETLRLCAMSVVSQALFYHHCRPVVARLFPKMKFDEAALEKLAGHITRFSIAAIKARGREERK